MKLTYGHEVVRGIARNAEMKTNAPVDLLQSCGSRPREGGAQLALPVVGVCKFLLVVCEPIRPRTGGAALGPDRIPNSWKKRNMSAVGFAWGARCVLMGDLRWTKL